jgi:hypothetical protein
VLRSGLSRDSQDAAADKDWLNQQALAAIEQQQAWMLLFARKIMREKRENEAA